MRAEDLRGRPRPGTGDSWEDAFTKYWVKLTRI